MNSDEITESVTKTKQKKPLKIDTVNEPVQEPEPSTQVETETGSTGVDKPKRKYTMTDKKKEQLAKLQEKKKIRDEEKKRLKEFEAYRALVENNLMDEAVSKLKHKVKQPKKSCRVFFF